MIFKGILLSSVLATLLRGLQVHGYIPAQPANVTAQPSQANARKLHLQWYTDGSDWEYVAQHSVRPDAGSDHVPGVLVHFTEDNAGNEATTTPWIAFVSCDANSTNSSREVDIFTMAKERGAELAILYSLYSETCIINPAESDRDSVLDIVTTQSLNASRRIEYEFGQFGPSSEKYYGYFNATMLNDAARAINSAIASNYPAVPGFLFATLLPYSASGAGVPNSGLHADANGTSTSTGSDSSGDTGVAMIILYAITGCVSALFCGVIVSGAIRAIRHPERYGPRRADPTLGGGQSRAGGLGRAILDTFPIVKFGSSGNDRVSSFSRPKDIESAPVDTESSIPAPSPNSVQLAQLDSMAEHDEHHHYPQEGPAATASQGATEDDRPSRARDQVDLSPQTSTTDQGALHVPASSHEIVPECIGRETCPICIVDFEEGDDLRVLPCEGKHRFHQSCVDPWLLELSGSCPICRQDFHALETIMSGGSEYEAPSTNRRRDSGASLTQNRRFSRYLRLALGRQRRASNGDRGSPPLPES